MAYWYTDTASPTDHTNPDEVARRHSHSPWPLQTVEDALSTILNHGSVCPVETVSYKNARGSYLAQAVYAPEPLPPFPASIKDGYAVIGMLFWKCFWATYVCLCIFVSLFMMKSLFVQAPLSLKEKNGFR